MHTCKRNRSLCIEMRVDMHVNMCVDMRVDMRANMCIDMCINMRVDLQVLFFRAVLVEVHGTPTCASIANSYRRVYMSTCLHPCTFTGLNICMFTGLHICMFASLHVYRHACTHPVHARAYLSTRPHSRSKKKRLSTCLHTCLSTRRYACLFTYHLPLATETPVAGA